MLSTVFITALLALTGVNARMEVQRRSDVPATYAQGYLENYDVYHARYMAIGCKEKHGTTFFNECCHPMLATETLAKNRPAQCNPKNIKATKTSSTPTATPSPSNEDEGEECEEGEEDCVCEPEDEPAPTSTHHTSTHHAASSTKKPAATPKSSNNNNNNNNNSGSSSGAKTGGFATFFYQNGNAGACGDYNSDDSKVAAIFTSLYGADGSRSSHCGQQIRITNTNNGKSVTVTVADECPSCVNANSIDLSVGAFTAIATEAEGMVPISWNWV